LIDFTARTDHLINPEEISLQHGLSPSLFSLYLADESCLDGSGEWLDNDDRAVLGPCHSKHRSETGENSFNLRKPMLQQQNIQSPHECLSL